MKKANISTYKVFSNVIVFIILLSISYTQIDAYKGSASTAQNKCGRYQIIATLAASKVFACRAF